MSNTEKGQQPEKAKQCPSPGNPVFSCMFAPPTKEKAARQKWAISQNILYRTSSNEYGRLPSTADTAPTTYRPKSYKFSKDLARCGMYQENSLNTAIDKSKVCDFSNLKKTV
ncbi:piercer of microtubule wall 2 protein [Synchiropus picturatus]